MRARVVIKRNFNGSREEEVMHNKLRISLMLLLLLNGSLLKLTRKIKIVMNCCLKRNKRYKKLKRLRDWRN